MSIDVRYVIDREIDFFGLSIDYDIPPYIDPETSEQFDETSWELSYDLASNPSPSTTSDSGRPSSGTVPLEMSLGGAAGVVNYRLSFEVYNTFMPVPEQIVWNIQMAGLATTPLVIEGTSIIDLSIGGDGDDMIRTFAGDDHIDAGGGGDVIDGGTGNDVIDGGDGDDIMIGGTGDDLFYVDSAADIVVERPSGGVDTVCSSVSYSLSAEVERLFLTGSDPIDGTGNAIGNLIVGTDAANTLFGLNGDDELRGGDGDDALYGGNGNDLLEGGAGDDRLVGGTGADTLVGDLGIDLAYYKTSAAAVSVNLATGEGSGGAAEGDSLIGVEAVYGSGHNDTIIGDTLANWLYGDKGDDWLRGGAGNDVIVGGAGADNLSGEDGIDTLSYVGSALGVVVDLHNQTVSGGDAQGDVISDFENVIGGNGDDQLTGTDETNTIQGRNGSDTIDGGDGNDRISGGAGGDVLDGGAGVDTLHYGGSADGVSINLVTAEASGGDAEGDVISNFENVTGGNGDDTITGNDGVNVLTGGFGDDTLNGGGGNDVIRGGAGADDLDGGDGIDTLSYAGSGGCGCFGGVIVDLSQGLSAYGDAEGDIFANFENVEGSEAGDLLIGDDNANRLSGRAGFDLLDGGKGNDTLSGGADFDQFFFATGYGRDVITDFAAGDFGELVVFDLGEAFDSFAEIMAVATQTGSLGQDVRFTFDAGTTLTLRNVSMAALTDYNFDFYI